MTTMPHMPIQNQTECLRIWASSSLDSPIGDARFKNFKGEPQVVDKFR